MGSDPLPHGDEKWKYIKYVIQSVSIVSKY